MKKILLAACCLTTTFLYAQHESGTEESFSPHHGIAFLLSHTHVSEGYVDGKKKWIVLPSWALDYNYFFSAKWSVGLHNDMIIENFKVEDHASGEVIEHTRPVASVVVTSFKPSKHFSFELGAGGEFSSEENYFLNRLGVEYSLELPHHWELLSNAVYDIKWEGYNSFAFGFGISKAFGFRKK